MKNIPFLGAALGVLALAAAPAQAAFQQLTEPAQISALGIFNIPDMGGASGATVPGPLVSTAGSKTATFSSTGSLFLFDSSGGNTAFADGTPLLETYDTSVFGNPTGPLKISFAGGVTAFGLYGQGAANTGTTSFTVTAFDGLTALGSYTTGPFDDNVTPGTYGFLGGLATGSDIITGLQISSASTQLGTGDDAIYGPVTYGVAAVPETSSSALLGLGVLPLALLGFRARKRTA